jgi:hypothetical protein
MNDVDIVAIIQRWDDKYNTYPGIFFAEPLNALFLTWIG